MSQLTGLTYQYRPRLLSDFAGNVTAVRTVRSIFRNGKRIPNAWLLEGPVGCGKTSMGRWISMRMNCTEVKDSDIDPCGECDSCMDMLQDPPNHPCHTEINCSDKRKLDDMRSLAKKARYNPVGGKKRIFLLDEPQGIIKEGQEAILIPLENPPPNTIWIFCTTEPGKLREAIVSRCEAGHLSFRRAPADSLAKRMYAICKSEKVKIPKKVLTRIAEITDGHPRSAIGVLDKAMSLIQDGEDIGKNELESFVLDAVEELGKSNPWAATLDIVASILKGDLPGAIRASKECDVPASVKLNFMARHWTQVMYRAASPNLVDKSHAWWFRKIRFAPHTDDAYLYAKCGGMLNNQLVMAKDHTSDDSLQMVTVISAMWATLAPEDD